MPHARANFFPLFHGVLGWWCWSWGCNYSSYNRMQRGHANRDGDPSTWQFHGVVLCSCIPGAKAALTVLVAVTKSSCRGRSGQCLLRTAVRFPGIIWVSSTESKYRIDPSLPHHGLYLASWPFVAPEYLLMLHMLASHCLNNLLSGISYVLLLDRSYLQMRCKNIDILLLGTAGILGGWARKDTYRLSTAEILCGWAV